MKKTSYKFSVLFIIIHLLFSCGGGGGGSSENNTTQSYTITFDKNDDSVTGTMTPQILEKNTTVNLNICAFTRADWTFSGWNTVSDGSGTDYADGTHYTMGTSNITLFAQWIFTPGEPGTTYYIDPAGNDITGDGTAGSPWRTLNMACDSVTTTGDIIHVNAGTYTVNTQCDLSVGVSIEGDGDESLIISHVTDDWSPTIMLTSPALGTDGNQHISHIKMSGNSATAWAGIYIAARSNVIVHDSTFVDFLYSAVLFNGKIADDDTSEPTIWSIGNRFYNNTTTNCSHYYINNYASGALHVGAQDGMLIYNNTMTQNSRADGYNGYLIKYYNFGYNRGLKIYNNTLVKAAPIDNSMDWNFAIELWHSRGGIEIYNNTIYGSVDFVHAYKGTYDFAWSVHDNTIGYTSLQIYNTAATNGGVFIERDQPGPVYIYNNHIRNVGTPLQAYPNGEDCIENIYIYNNVFSGTGTVSGEGWLTLMGWSISSGTGLPPINNFNFVNNTVYVGGGGAVYGMQLPDIGNAANVNIRNNIFWGFANNPIYGGLDGSETIDFLSIENNIFYGNGTNAPNLSGSVPGNYTEANNIVGKPAFVTEGSDYHLQTGSIGIGEGLSHDWITDDFEGVTVGNPPNIGCFETVVD